MLNELYSYRELLKSNVKKEIRGKYKASFLGVLWSFINPLLQVLVYAIVFPYLLGNRVDNYVVYLITGIIPWTYFQTVLNSCVTCVKSNAGIIKKVYFPRIILPISAAVSGVINFFISCIIILVFCVVYNVGISWHLIFVPLYAVLEGIIALGIGMALGACDAYVQDLEYIVNFILTLAFYGSPIVYQVNQFGGQSLIGKLIRINPITMLINGFRNCFLYHQVPDVGELLILVIIAIIIIILGYWIFRKLEKGFAEQF